MSDKKIIIVDLDGTLARSDQVRHLLPNYDLFYKACCYVDVNEAVKTCIRAMWVSRYEIWIVSGRSDAVKIGTERWLKHNEIPYDQLIMRQAGDHTPDDKLKKSWITSGKIPQDRILFCLDDRDRVVKMWRDLGLSVFQVNYGDF